MGLLQKAVETYDCHREYAGKLREGHDVLAPVSHSLTRAKVEITINANGDFVSAQAVDKDAPKIVIPVTEESAGRSGTGAFKLPHPLCDKLSYLIAEPNYYIPQLDDWAQSSFCHPKTLAILNYVKRKTLLSDLSASGCVTRNDKGEINQKDDMICWRVIGRDEETPSACWMDQSLFEAYSSYYQAKKAQGNRAVCMISGEELPAAVQHPKGIVAFSGNAKLISSNDDKGFTYRGRFDADWQAVSVGYVSTQKAHNALRWIISEQGAAAVFGGRTFLCWNPKGYQVCSVVGPFRKNAAVRTEPTDYRKELQRTLAGYQTELPEMEGVVIAAFDAATSGRLSLTYYNELIGSDFLQRLYDWDLTCCWHNGPFGIQSPGLKQIVDCAFGTQRTEKNQIRIVTDDRVLRQQMQRLVACRVDRAKIPMDIVRALTGRASMPQAYDAKLWRKIIFTACAVLNKYEAPRKGVDAMAWDLDTKDRSFQFGRLLAAMERVEQDYYYKTKEERQTSAIKAMSEFRRRPWTIYERITRHLNQAYIPRIEGWQRTRYTKVKDEIIGIIRQFPENELNKPLEDIYLLGYDLQHAEFYKSTKDTSVKEEEQV